MVSIYLLTDFGNNDYYVCAMRGIIRTLCPRAEIVDISNNVRKFDVRHGAFILWQAIKWIEKGSIILGVVDPGVGTSRDPIIIKSRNHYFVGPDNGLFYPSIQDSEFDLYKIDLRGTGLAQKRTGTFDGRDVFAPIAAMLACGKSPDELGFKKKSMKVLDIWEVRIRESSVEGEVMNIDRFGNVVTNIRWEEVRSDNAIVSLGHISARAFKSSSYNGKGLLMIRGSTELLELSLARGSAADFLEADMGDKVRLNWMR